MNKIIDCFMFFQELDLLKIRLEYLFPYVDKFIIVESSQTHAGNKKEFIFEKNLGHFKKYLNKITYFKLEESHKNLKSIRDKLNLDNSEESKKVLNAINQVYANNKNLNEKSLIWLIDIYQRESIFIPLMKLKPQEDDIIMISDLDEIPNYELISKLKVNFNYKIMTINHNEFSYFLNLNSRNDWLGTIVTSWKYLKDHSLNLLRVDAKKNNKIVKIHKSKFQSYHFTSCGDIDMIKNKIINFGHQEFNNKLIISNLEKNISHERDIFGRKINQKFRLIDISNALFFDKRMQEVLLNFKHLIKSTKNKSNFFSYVLFYFYVKLQRYSNYLLKNIRI